MSFLFGQKPHVPSSQEKIAAAEAEIEMVSNMFNQYVVSRAISRQCALTNGSLQTSRHLHEEMHTRTIPRSRSQQRRISMSRPMRGQVLRGQCEGIGEDAGRGGAERRWRRWRRQHVRKLKELSSCCGLPSLESARHYAIEDAARTECSAQIRDGSVA